MYSFKTVLLYGFAIFAMFFGSGNLIFPLQIGMASGSNWNISLLGLFITGIFLPLLGLFVIKLYKGDYYAFFGEAGRVSRKLLPFLTLSLLGSFGVVPRCVTVAFGGIHALCPSITLLGFSILFCAVTFLLCLKDKFMVNAIGKWMSPLLLIILCILITLGIWQANDAPLTETRWTAFENGFFTGYQTMDLFAAFFFSSFIFSQIKQGLGAATHESTVLRCAIYSSIIGATLLLGIYAGFVFLGAHYSAFLTHVAPEMLLPTIVQQTMGNTGSILVSIAIVLTCLTTAIALNNIYARYICAELKLAPQRFPLILLGTTALSFTVSLLDFKGISGFLAPILTVLYPGIIILTIMCIITKKYSRSKSLLFYFISLFMAYRLL